jgi:L-ascorbate metabolism protein UlaG (beta-lactamase superfamily)
MFMLKKSSFFLCLFSLLIPAELCSQQEPIFKHGRYYNDAADNTWHFVSGPAVLFATCKNIFSYGRCDKGSWCEQVMPPVSSEEPRITWLGHSSFLIQLGGCNILTDPVFGNILAHVRKSPLGILPEQLPPIDYVLISHNHRDHMDKASLEWLLDNRNPVFLVPVGTVLPLKNFHIMHEKTWWQTFEADDVAFTFLPANHWSGSNLLDFRKALWGSWMITHNGHSIYFAGDSAYGQHFKAIAAVFPSIEVALLPIGPETPHSKVKYSHMDAHEAVQAFIDLQAQSFIPMHWGTFRFGGDAFV